MNKIRVVQMMAVASGDEQDWRYLDDKGRVWYQGLSGDWYQLPMPNEPQESPEEIYDVDDLRTLQRIELREIVEGEKK